PGFFSANASIISTSFEAWRSPSASSAVILFASVNTEVSMNSIRPSYICAFDAKWRYSAASETSSFSASAAVVIFPHFGCSSICASAFRISSRRSPFTRGIAKFYAASRSARVAQREARQLRDRIDAQVDIRHAARRDAHPDRGHPEPFGGAQVLQHVVYQRAALRLQVVRAQQHAEPLEGGFG